MQLGVSGAHNFDPSFLRVELSIIYIVTTLTLDMRLRYMITHA
jgi:hypothetical protein